MEFLDITAGAINFHDYYIVQGENSTTFYLKDKKKEEKELADCSKLKGFFLNLRLKRKHKKDLKAFRSYINPYLKQMFQKIQTKLDENSQLHQIDEKSYSSENLTLLSDNLASLCYLQENIKKIDQLFEQSSAKTNLFKRILQSIKQLNKASIKCL